MRTRRKPLEVEAVGGETPSHWRSIARRSDPNALRVDPSARPAQAALAHPAVVSGPWPVVAAVAVPASAPAANARAAPLLI
eukprot:3452134-Heterocapsa_arctica.AAC.1